MADRGRKAFPYSNPNLAERYYKEDFSLHRERLQNIQGVVSNVQSEPATSAYLENRLHQRFRQFKRQEKVDNENVRLFSRLTEIAAANPESTQSCFGGCNNELHKFRSSLQIKPGIRLNMNQVPQIDCYNFKYMQSTSKEFERFKAAWHRADAAAKKQGEIDQALQAAVWREQELELARLESDQRYQDRGNLRERRDGIISKIQAGLLEVTKLHDFREKAAAELGDLDSASFLNFTRSAAMPVHTLVGTGYHSTLCQVHATSSPCHQRCNIEYLLPVGDFMDCVCLTGNPACLKCGCIAACHYHARHKLCTEELPLDLVLEGVKAAFEAAGGQNANIGSYAGTIDLLLQQQEKLYDSIVELCEKLKRVATDFSAEDELQGTVGFLRSHVDKRTDSEVKRDAENILERVSSLIDSGGKRMRRDNIITTIQDKLFKILKLKTMHEKIKPFEDLATNGDERSFGHYIKEEQAAVYDLEETPYHNTMCQVHAVNVICHERCGLDYHADQGDGAYFAGCACMGTDDDGNVCCTVSGCGCLPVYHYHAMVKPVKKEQNIETSLNAIQETGESNPVDLGSFSETMDLVKGKQQEGFEAIKAACLELKQCCADFSFAEELQGTIKCLEKHVESCTDPEAKWEAERFLDEIRAIAAGDAAQASALEQDVESMASNGIRKQHAVDGGFIAAAKVEQLKRQYILQAEASRASVRRTNARLLSASSLPGRPYSARPKSSGLTNRPNQQQRPYSSASYLPRPQSYGHISRSGISDVGPLPPPVARSSDDDAYRRQLAESGIIEDDGDDDFDEEVMSRPQESPKERAPTQQSRALSSNNKVWPPYFLGMAAGRPTTAPSSRPRFSATSNPLRHPPSEVETNQDPESKPQHLRSTRHSRPQSAPWMVQDSANVVKVTVSDRPIPNSSSRAVSPENMRRAWSPRGSAGPAELARTPSRGPFDDAGVYLRPKGGNNAVSELEPDIIYVPLLAPKQAAPAPKVRKSQLPVDNLYTSERVTKEAVPASDFQESKPKLRDPGLAPSTPDRQISPDPALEKTPEPSFTPKTPPEKILGPAKSQGRSTVSVGTQTTADLSSGRSGRKKGRSASLGSDRASRKDRAEQLTPGPSVLEEPRAISLARPPTSPTAPSTPEQPVSEKLRASSTTSSLDSGTQKTESPAVSVGISAAQISERDFAPEPSAESSSTRPQGVSHTATVPSVPPVQIDYTEAESLAKTNKKANLQSLFRKGSTSEYFDPVAFGQQYPQYAGRPVAFVLREVVEGTLQLGKLGEVAAFLESALNLKQGEKVSVKRFNRLLDLCCRSTSQQPKPIPDVTKHVYDKFESWSGCTIDRNKYYVRSEDTGQSTHTELSRNTLWALAVECNFVPGLENCDPNYREGKKDTVNYLLKKKQRSKAQAKSQFQTQTTAPDAVAGKNSTSETPVKPATQVVATNGNLSKPSGDPKAPTPAPGPKDGSGSNTPVSPAAPATGDISKDERLSTKRTVEGSTKRPASASARKSVKGSLDKKSTADATEEHDAGAEQEDSTDLSFNPNAPKIVRQDSLTFFPNLAPLDSPTASTPFFSSQADGHARQPAPSISGLSVPGINPMTSQADGQAPAEGQSGTSLDAKANVDRQLRSSMSLFSNAGGSPRNSLHFWSEADASFVMQTLEAVTPEFVEQASNQNDIVKAVTLLAQNNTPKHVWYAAAACAQDLTAALVKTGDISQLNRLRTALRSLLSHRAMPAEETYTAPLALGLRASLAYTYREADYLPEAQKTYEELVADLTREKGAAHVETVSMVVALGDVLIDRNESAKAKELLEQTLQQLETTGPTLPPNDSRRMLLRHRLADVMLFMGEAEQAEVQYRELLETRYHYLDDDAGPDAATLLTATDLAACLQEQGKLVEAQELYEGTLPLLRDVLGMVDERLMQAINSYAECLASQSKYTEAVEQLETLRAHFIEAIGPQHPNVAVVASNLGLAHAALGQHKAAAQFLAEALDIRVRDAQSRDRGLAPRATDQHVITALNNLGFCLMDGDRSAEAHKYFEDALSSSRVLYGEKGDVTIRAKQNLATCLCACNLPTAAKGWMEEVVTLLEERHGAQHPELATALTNLALLYESESQPSKALSLFERALEIRRLAHGSTHPSSLQAQYQLVDCLTSLSKYAEAEPLLEELQKNLEATLGEGDAKVKEVSEMLRACREKRAEELRPVDDGAGGPREPSPFAAAASSSIVPKDLKRERQGSSPSISEIEAL